MKIHLAPMEGVVDPILRDLLTKLGGIDACVTEFIRVTQSVLPDRVFLDYCPELTTNSCTPSGTPISVQLLGSDLDMLAANAQQAVKLGAKCIDMNFGCPAKTVNRHDGGAVLLKNPERLYQILHRLRTELPMEVPVTAKMRLGFLDKSLYLENAEACEQAGAAHLVVHARTKEEGYRPPAHWHFIADIRQRLRIPVIANGDIFTVQDFLRCQEITGCDQFMLGRGLLQNPFLALEIKNHDAQIVVPQHSRTAADPHSLAELLQNFFSRQREVSDKLAVARTKMWMKQLTSSHPSLIPLFDRIKIQLDASLMEKTLQEFFQNLPENTI